MIFDFPARYLTNNRLCGLLCLDPAAPSSMAFTARRAGASLQGGVMLRRMLVATLFAAGAISSPAQPSLPSSFYALTVHSPENAEIFVRYGGTGPVVVLLHGYAENSDSWGPLAQDLMKDHTVVVPDLRGIGRSSKPAGGYDKKTQAKDIRAVVTALGYDRTFVVAHDIGNMVAYAYAATYPDKVERLVVMDAPIPGIEPWSEILQNPGVWHFNFHGPDAERLVEGRERIYFDRIWNDFTGDPSKPDEATRDFFTATYAQPGGMRAGFAQFTAFSQDAKDNKIFEQTKLTMPVLAVGGEKSFGPLQAVIMRNVATNVREAVVAGSGHWLMEERPVETVALIRGFLDASPEERLTLADYKFPVQGNPGTGSSGVAGIQTVVLKGDPDQAGVYTIMLRVPAHTRIAAHSHRDDRVATVISGTWRIGYGDRFDESKLKALPPGSYYTEPPGQTHFAETGDEPVVVQITGFGPSSTDYIDHGDDPRNSQKTE
jgi:pimeloyl-ACP methyl ester carboxylesterase/quercetin dioxygenase-like cupin family protein